MTRTQQAAAHFVINWTCPRFVSPFRVCIGSNPECHMETEKVETVANVTFGALVNSPLSTFKRLLDRI